MLKTFITKSRAGHYTVTIQTDRYSVLYKRYLIDNLQSARWFAQEFLRQMPTPEAGEVRFVEAKDGAIVLRTSTGGEFWARSVEQLRYMLQVLGLSYNAAASSSMDFADEYGFARRSDAWDMYHAAQQGLDLATV